jgi:hypothetical protein
MSRTSHVTRALRINGPKDQSFRSSRTAMLEELSNMDRITQLQNEIQNASPSP